MARLHVLASRKVQQNRRGIIASSTQLTQTLFEAYQATSQIMSNLYQNYTDIDEDPTVRNLLYDGSTIKYNNDKQEMLEAYQALSGIREDLKTLYQTYKDTPAWRDDVNFNPNQLEQYPIPDWKVDYWTSGIIPSGII